MRNAIDSAGSFAGAVYDPQFDLKRLSLQIERIRAQALPRDWFTLREARVDLERLYAPTIFPREFTIGPAFVTSRNFHFPTGY